jgi:hypothetical protein
MIKTNQHNWIYIRQTDAVRIMLLLLAILSLLPGCKSGSGHDPETSVTTDIIQNPVTADKPKADGTLPVLKFETEKHDFNLLLQGEVVTYKFTFENTGGSNLVLVDVTAACGCTVPSFSKEPVKPGETGEIEVMFNSSNLTGFQRKTITVLANTQPNRVELEISANVIIPDKY